MGDLRSSLGVNPIGFYRSCNGLRGPSSPFLLDANYWRSDTDCTKPLRIPPLLSLTSVTRKGEEYRGLMRVTETSPRGGIHVQGRLSDPV